MAVTLVTTSSDVAVSAHAPASAVPAQSDAAAPTARQPNDSGSTGSNATVPLPTDPASPDAPMVLVRGSITADPKTGIRAFTPAPGVVVPVVPKTPVTIDPAPPVIPPQTDFTAPTRPRNVLTVSNATSLDLSWQASTDDTAVTAYRIYQDHLSATEANDIIFHHGNWPDESLFTVVATTPDNTPAYTATGLQDGEYYAFEITALDAAGNESTPGYFIGSTDDRTPPPAPTGLTSTPGDGSVTLDWTGPRVDFAYYNVYQDGVLVARLDAPTVPSTVISGLTNGQTYTFTVTASDNARNESAPSAAVPAIPAP